MYLGDFVLGSIVDHKFTTVNSSGAPTTLSGGPAVQCYKANGASLSGATGITLTVDFNSTTGLNHVRIDASVNTAFFTQGGEFQIVITTGTVGGTSVVGYVVGAFSILNRYAGQPLVRGVVGNGSTTTVIQTSSLTPAASDPDQWKGRIVIFDTNTATAGLRGEAASIQTMTAGGVLTIDALSRSPVSGDVFGIY